MSEGLEYETIVQNGPRKVSAFYFFCYIDGMGE